jgi:hypothetical protein
MSRKQIGKMTIKECQAEIVDNETKQSDVCSQIKPLEDKFRRLSNRNDELRNRIARVKSKQKKIDWDWLLYCDWKDAGVHHKYREEVLNKIGLRSSGYYQEINQTCVQVMLYRNKPDSLKKTLSGLKKVLPYLKSVKDGFVRVDIFEHTLSEGGVYDLWIDKEEKKYQIRKTTYGREEILKEFNDLKKALEYIQEHHYYETC